MGVVVIGVAVFLSYLVYLKATQLGHQEAVIWRALGIVWLCLAAAVVVLAGARAILGGPIIQYSATQGGLRLSSDRPDSLYITIGTLVVVGILLYAALRTVRQLQQPSNNHPAAGDNSEES